MGRIACFSDQQQEIFEKLNPKHQRYVIYRGQGYTRAEAYEMAGYKEKNRGFGGYNLETRIKPAMVELINALNGSAIHNSLYGESSGTSQDIDAKAESPTTEELATAGSGLPQVQRFSGEDAKRLQFYRQIANGTIKTVKTTKTYDKDGNLTGKKVEEVEDIESKIKARREIDRILGLNDVINVGQIEANGIKIMIVDATKREETDDQRGETINGTTSK